MKLFKPIKFYTSRVYAFDSIRPDPMLKYKVIGKLPNRLDFRTLRLTLVTGLAYYLREDSLKTYPKTLYGSYRLYQVRKVFKRYVTSKRKT